MLVKLVYFVLLSMPFGGVAFRAPDNVPRNVELPKIGGPKTKVAPEESALQTPNRHATKRKRWGVDNDHAEEEYWFDSRVHTLGNIGFLGSIHAFLAPISTKIIDIVAYNSTDLRQVVSKSLVTLRGIGTRASSKLTLC